MFAIPGILGLLFFVYLRLHEVYEELLVVPFVYLILLLIIFGASVDLRLRITKAMPTPLLPAAVALAGWALITVGITSSEQMVPSIIDWAMKFLILLLISQSIQRFMVFEKVAVMLVVLGIFLTGVAIDQSLSSTECVVVPVDTGKPNELGIPTGKPCTRPWQCYEDSPDPANEYICEKAGVLGTHSVSGRVRYRGVLQDPNELALAMSASWALLIGFWMRTRRRSLMIATVVTGVMVAWAIMATGSRSGQLGFVGVIGVFLLWRYGWKLAMLGAPLLPAVLLALSAGGGERADAGQSTLDRYEAWAEAVLMVRGSPIWGVGYNQFNAYHHLTAHNTFFLAIAEMGFVGIMIFMSLVWLTIKIPLTGALRYRGNPDARVAEIWCVSFLAAMAAIVSGAAFLSFTYHYILWIFMGLSGGLYISIKRHDPEFRVHFGFYDVLGIAVVNVLLFLGLAAWVRLKGF